MSNAVLILGESGAGKTTSLRNLDPAKCLLLQPVPKNLPFKNNGWHPLHRDASGNIAGSIFVTDKPAEIVDSIKNAPALGKEIVIIDDFQYIMANEFMHKASVKGFEKFTESGKHAWDIVMAANQADPRLRIYILSHIQADEMGRQRIKTIGKLLDEKIVIEGLFTIVLKAVVEHGVHCFRTKNNGNDTTKSPMGMFDSEFIDNDLNLVDQIYLSYYNLK